MVKQTAWGRDQHVNALVDQLVLVLEGRAANQQGLGKLSVFGICVKVLGHLGSQLAGRCQYKGTRHPRTCTTTAQQGNHRQRKGGSFARTRLRNAQNIAALKRRHNRANLNRCRCFIACFGDGFKNLGVKVEIGEFGQVSPFNMLRLFGRSYCAARLTELSGRSTVHGLRPKWSKGQGNPIRAGAWWQVPADLRSAMRYKTT